MNSIILFPSHLAGIGSNKLIAQMATTLIEPSELYNVRHGSEQVFISPLPVPTLPGLHRPYMRKVLERLDDLNLLTLGEVADVSQCPQEGAHMRW